MKELENLPSEEQVEAYVLHLRKFIQRNDLVNIENIGKSVRKYLYQNKIDTEQWNILISRYKQMIKSQSLLNKYIINIQNLTYYDSVSAKIYGDLAHLTEEKRELYNKICKMDLTHKLHDLEFYDFLTDTGEIIIEMSRFLEENIFI